MKRRILYFVIAMLAMIPAALTYADGGLLSGFPSSATVGDSVTWSVDPGDEEGSLKVSASGASVSVSGNSFTVSFDQAGTAKINASIGGSSDSCSVTVKEAESSSSEGGSGSDGDGSDSADTGSSGSDDSGSDGSGSDGSGSDDSGSDGSGSADEQDASGTSSKETADASGESAGDGTGNTAQAGQEGSADSSAAAAADSSSDAAAAASADQTDGSDAKRTMPKGSGSLQRSGGAGNQGGSGAASAGTSSTDSKTTYTGSANNYLKSLKVDGYDFTQSFHKTLNSYFLSVDDGADSLDVTAVASDSDAEVVVTGTDELTTGRNKIMVSVTAENGDVRVYRIYADVR